MGGVTPSGHAGGHAADRIQTLCEACVQETNVDGAGLAILATDGTPEPVYVSDPRSRLIEDLQFTLGEGPCMDAVSSGAPVLVDDLRALVDRAHRWPAFSGEVEPTGVRAVFAFPIRIGAVALGTLDLYRDSPGGLSTRELGLALKTVDRAGALLLDLGASTLDAAVEPTYRMVVHQAAGMVMAQLDTTVDVALARLRAAAYGEDIPINELAKDVVSGRRRFSEERK